MLLRLNLDKVKHPIHCYYPASGKKFFDRLRYCCQYRENIEVIEHPVKNEGIVEENGKFKIEAYFLDHGVDNVGWRISEPDEIKFYKDRLKQIGLNGPIIRELEKNGSIQFNDQTIRLEDVSYVRQGDVFAYVIDTRPCPNAIKIAKGAKLLLCEATYLDEEKEMANEYMHMTAKQAAQIAKEANVQNLVLTHFSARYKNFQPF